MRASTSNPVRAGVLRLGGVLVALVAGVTASANERTDALFRDALATYRFPTQVAGFHMEPAQASPGLFYGLELAWIAEAHPDVELLVLLYRTPSRGNDEAALRDATARYFGRLRGIAGDRRLRGSRKASDVRVEAGDSEWHGRAHAFTLGEGRSRERVQAMLFLVAGHIVELRASGPFDALEQTEMHGQALSFAERFLPALEIVQRACGSEGVAYVLMPAQGADARRTGVVEAESVAAPSGCATEDDPAR